MAYKVTKIKLIRDTEHGPKSESILVSEVTPDIEKFRKHACKQYQIPRVHLDYVEQPT